MTEEVDVSSSGISFIDILFALVVSVIMGPIQGWVRVPNRNHMPKGDLLHLILALIFVLTSWIGYHNSANRPQFKIRFFNVELVKFVLDICMVVVYFIVASIATRHPLSNRGETTLVLAAFALYLLWDIAGFLQKSPGNKYEIAWGVEKAITPDIGQWKPRRIERVITTAAFGAMVLILTAIVWVQATPVSVGSSVFCDAVLIAILIAYRFTKDHVAI